MNINIVEECAKLSEEEKITFPEVVERLNKAGVESYAVNMLVPNKIYYAGNKAHVVPLKIKAALNVAADFNQDHIVQALHDIQSKKIGYQEFLKLIMEGGVISYFVYIKGRKAVYCGKHGEQYTELFPSK
jgi:uncharacterized protein YbcV (DUF1398 family)